MRLSSQAREVREKYSDEGEFGFWNTFAELGLLPYEAAACAAWLHPGACVLDIGCGCGREAAALVQAGYKVHALDIAEKMVAATRDRLLDQNASAHVVCADASEGIPFSGRYDAVLLFEQVYQHLPLQPSRADLLTNIRGCLTPKGVLLLSAFNEGDISLSDRWRWLRETRFWLARAIVLGGFNPLDTRYMVGAQLTPPPHANSLLDHMRVGRWLCGYLWGLMRRKYRARKAARSEAAQCKRIGRTNPSVESPGGFLIRVFSFSELHAELAHAGLEAKAVYPLGDDDGNLSEAARRGAPLLLIAAQLADQDAG